MVNGCINWVGAGGAQVFVSIIYKFLSVVGFCGMIGFVLRATTDGFVYNLKDFKI